MSLAFAMIKTYRNNDSDRETIDKIRKRRLKKLVDFARSESPFYKKLYENIGSEFSLEELPAVSKPEMMKNFDDILTDRSITMSRIDEFTSDIDNVGQMIDGKYLIFKTSGSTGNTAVVLYDKQNIDVSSAVAAFRTFARHEDYKAFMKHGKKTAGVFANYGFYLACGMSRYLQLQMPHKKTKITVDVNAPETEIVKKLNDFQPCMLSGYPSNLSLLADQKELNIKPDVIITGGELLTDDIRKKLSDKFGCYVQTHYSCTEAGEIACECSERHLHINEDWVIVEPVDKNNKPVAFGEMSDKVLITNLSNYIQPFIRYELTDRIIVHDEQCKCGRKMHWLEIEGRTDDILSFENGVSVAPMSLYKILEKVKSVQRFQLVQRAVNKLELLLITSDRESAFSQCKADLIEFFESKGVHNIEISLSNELPQANKTSGKFKHIYADFSK
ncbi:MAG: phenylacetate--CoA ligase family protein [Clostridia bacterium]|nr:phenylacetate--CoA ligase family protein [Clostridia bacterium]